MQNGYSNSHKSSHCSDNETLFLAIYCMLTFSLQRWMNAPDLIKVSALRGALIHWEVITVRVTLDMNLPLTDAAVRVRA